MKKIFTLAGMALFAMSMNAQTVRVNCNDDDILAKMAAADASDEDPASLNTSGATWVIYKDVKIFPAGTYEAGQASGDWSLITGDANAKAMVERAWSVEDASIDFVAVGSPNVDKVVNKEAIWKKWINPADNMVLKAEGYPTFDLPWRPDGSNPGISYIGFYEETKNNDGEITGNGPKNFQVNWTPGCGVAPAKGCYYKLTTKVAGKLVFGFYLHQANKIFYICEGATGNAVENVALAYYAGNNTLDFQTGTLSTEGFVAPANKTIGYATIETEAGKEYYFFANDTQLGFYGFEFTPSASGISEITTANDANAPVYNLAGQRVSNDTKGLLIKNGKKFINK